MNDCLKKTYPSQVQALLALRAIQRRATGQQRTPPTGVYLCPACRRSWHLTSKSGVQTAPWARPRPSRIGQEQARRRMPAARE